MQWNLQNALTLLHKFGRSDLFITFTANASWCEVQDMLLPNQSAHECPNLITCVFHLKFESPLDDIMKKNIFSQAIGYIYTVKYQKCGLPHTHLIIFLNCSSQLATPEAVDKYISTEIPDENTHPWLFNLVKQFMVHSPCGPGLSSPCMDYHNQCMKNFPKPYLTNTKITRVSYMHTWHHDDGHFIRLGNHFVNNWYIVLYSPYLTLCYEAHINVECTAGFHAVKYIYKVYTTFLLDYFCAHIVNSQYIYKGLDQVCLTVHSLANPDGMQTLQDSDRDKTKVYIDGQHISAPEAFWRLSSWAMHRVCCPLTRQQCDWCDST